MRSKRMRGYGSWSIGWKEAERTSNRSFNKDPGFGMVILYGFMILLVMTLFQVAVQTGNFLGFLLGIAILAGLAKK